MAVLVLAYLLIVQCMTAAALLLAQFIALQAKSLTMLFKEPPRPLPAPAREVHAARGEQSQQVIIGGPIRRWE